MAYKDVTLKARSEKSAMNELDKNILRHYTIKKKSCLMKSSKNSDGIYVFKLVRRK